MDIVWDGITRAEVLGEKAARVRHALADAARSYDWPRVFELIAEHPELVNTTRPGGEATLVSKSWCRVVGGSGQRHEITSAGSQLVEAGFV